MTIERDTITLPVYWASALINGDYSGLTEIEAAHVRAAQDQLANEGWSIVGDVEDSQRFTWHYRLYHTEADCAGGDVVDYIILRTSRKDTR